MSPAHSAHPGVFGTSRIFRLLRSLRQRSAALPSSFRLSMPLLAIVAVAPWLVLCASLARADTYWGVGSGDWSTGSNWGGTAPTTSDTAYILNGGTAALTLPGEVCGALSLDSSEGSGTVQMTGGGLSTASYEHMGDSGVGTFAQSGGTNSIGGGLCLGSDPGSSGSYNLNGGELVVSVMSQGSGAAAFNFGGGTLLAGGNLSTTLPMILTGNCGSGQWVNATSLNIGGTSQFMGVGAWTSADTVLGEYGVNTANDTVWAVLDHNSQFAVVPEPSTLALLSATAVAGLIWWRRRK